MLKPRAVLVLVVFVGILTTVPVVGAPEFRPIFDGKTLEAWEGADMRYWSVKDGAITAQSTTELPCKKNQFLVWQGGIVDDFELEMKFRILGPPNANSGIQIRSQMNPDGHAEGYQADLDRAGNWRGALYDEHTPRRMLAKAGQKTVISEDGKRTSTDLDNAPPKVDPDAWSTYTITARGPHIVLRINGQVTAEVIDEEKGQRDLWGSLALQLHSGPAMTVQFKDIRLKRLPLGEGRKKVVLLAGAPSHASGEHEFNAGVRILTKRLRKVEGVIAANYHDNGWPKDPTAFDNADAVVLYSDGGGRHPFVGHLDTIEELMKRGVGLMCMHYAVEVPAGEAGEAFKRWIGGYYEHLYSSNPHWDADLVVLEDHPITRGVNKATIYDEWYFSIRFREGMKGITSILKAKPSDKTRSKNGWPPKPYPHILERKGEIETLMWAVQRKNGSRGVGFTGGHWHRNWAYDTQRQVILNAMVWVAGAEVPPEGVKSAPVTKDELNTNLDKKSKIKEIDLPKAL